MKKKGGFKDDFIALAEAVQALQNNNDNNKRPREASDAWSIPNIERSLAAQHITITQRVELAQLARSFLFAPDAKEKYSELHMVARTLPTGIIDWEQQCVPEWTASVDALELAHALYHQRDAARGATALQSQGKYLEAEAKIRELQQQIVSHIKARDDFSIQLVQSREAQKRAQDSASAARHDLQAIAAENALLLQHTKNALQQTGNSAADIVLSAKNEFIARAKESGIHEETVHDLAQVILRCITKIKCLYNGIPTTHGGGGGGGSGGI